MEEKVSIAILEAMQAIQALDTPVAKNFIIKAAERISAAFQRGNKLLIAGNGGSLCDAMHFAEELSGYFRKKRAALPAIALADVGHMSCVANDVGYDFVFERSVSAFGKKGDILVSLTTSGNSTNLYYALLKAKESGLETISFLGKGGGKIKGFSDLEWIVDGGAYSDRIQEAHMAAIHIIIEMVEYQLFYAANALSCERNET
ncbi:MAG: SIS domain-containing protein [Parachlamydiales bacterium]|nr:SIS domain-containing protein [Parachlamydiales bacterium]